MAASLNTAGIRYRENLLFALLSVLGYLFGARELNVVGILKCLVFAANMYALCCAMRYFGQQINSHSEKPVKDQKKIAFALLVFSLSVTFLVFMKVFWMWFAALVLCAAYFSDWTKIKNTPVASTFVFFCLAVVLFAGGYGVEFSIDANAFIFSIYFGILFAAGQLVGEIIEHNFDVAKERNSNVTIFGAAKVSRFSFSLFAGAFVYLMMLTVAGLVMPVYSLPFLIAFLLQAIVFLKPGKVSLTQRAMLFQFAYRSLYGIAAVVFVVFRFVFSL